jgi:hypothetical protein
VTGISSAEALPLFLRAHIEPRPTRARQSTRRKQSRKPVEPSEWALIFDVETGTDAAQHRRFLCYQVRKAGNLRREGIAYEPASLTRAEVETLTTYAVSQGLELLTVNEFVEERFFPILYDLAGHCILFNAPFDLSRLAVSHKAGKGYYRGWFRLLLTNNPSFPPVYVKHLNRHAAFIQFAVPPGRSPEQRNREHGGNLEHHRGAFVDAKTAGDALLGGSHTLARLAQLLETPSQKLHVDEHGGPLTAEYIDYARADVQSTWECYRSLDRRFQEFNLPLRLPKLYSEASLGKASLRALGIRSWQTLQPDFDPALLGKIMTSYFGGRVAVKRRHTVDRVLHCDFLSMYPTVCTLMGLWRFAISTGIDAEDATQDVRDLLATVTPGQLRKPSFWKKLNVLVEVAPDGDLFPARSDYAGSGELSIGLNYLTGGRLWFTLADCLVSTLATGKPPRVLRALRFRTRRRQRGLKPLAIAGNPDYLIDPRQHDFYKRLIELRRQVKNAARDADQAGDTVLAGRLDAEQQALKLMANATSYGIFAELNHSHLDPAQIFTCHGATGDRFPTEIHRLEKPGNFFHPLLATLITGAARLLLALAEHAARDQGLGWVFCDTDSIALSKTDQLDEDTFLERAHAVCDWFTPLNPYAGGGRLLEIEDVNYRLHQGAPIGELEPLYCLAVSAKRYVLFNIDDQGRPVIRKASAHGLGHLEPPYGEESAPRAIPPPALPLRKLGLQRWHYDLWYRIAEAALQGDPSAVKLDDLPCFNRPAMIAYTATTPNQLAWFETYNRKHTYAKQVRPFGFYQAPILTDDGLPVGQDPDRFRLVCPYTKDQRQWSKRRYTNIYNPDHPSFAISTSLRTDTIARVTSYRELALDYVRHPEPKSLGPDGTPCGELTRGPLEPRHIQVGTVNYIGKEAGDYDETGPANADETATRYADARTRELAEHTRLILEHSTRTSIVNLTGLSPATIRGYLDERTQPQPETADKLNRAAVTLARQQVRKRGIDPPQSDRAALERHAALLAESGPDRICEGGCGRSLDGPRKRLCNGCKQRQYRERQRIRRRSTMRAA